jgi:hypothetical protein
LRAAHTQRGWPSHDLVTLIIAPGQWQIEQPAKGWPGERDHRRFGLSQFDPAKPFAADGGARDRILEVVIAAHR